MLERHYTKDGATLLVAQMSNQHLTAMIRLIIKGMRENREAIEKDETMTAYQRRLYNIPEKDPRTVASQNRAAIEKLYPYLAEAFLRGDDFDQVRDDLQTELGRSGQIGGTNYYDRSEEVALLEESLARPSSSFVSLDDDGDIPF